MPRPSSEDIRWRAIWMKEMLGYQVNEVAASLKMSLSFKLWSDNVNWNSCIHYRVNSLTHPLYSVNCRGSRTKNRTVLVFIFCPLIVVHFVSPARWSRKKLKWVETACDWITVTSLTLYINTKLGCACVAFASIFVFTKHAKANLSYSSRVAFISNTWKRTITG